MVLRDGRVGGNRHGDMGRQTIFGNEEKTQTATEGQNMKISDEAYAHCPRHADSFKRYFEEGILPGGFLQAFLANDLYFAVQRADPTNINMLREYLWWMDEHAPRESYGSVSNIRAWVRKFPNHEEMLKRLEV